MQVQGIEIENVPFPQVDEIRKVSDSVDLPFFPRLIYEFIKVG